jgi:hypothetical protein
VSVRGDTNKSQEDMMRVMTLAVAAVLAVSLAVPASAAKAKRKAPAPTVGSFEKCEQLAIERGVPHGQTGHTEFVQQCMGQRPKGRPTG